MYISIKLPPEFGSFNRIRKDNYPFNVLFTGYLAAISRLGLAMQADVDELVGWIEDRVCGDGRLPDIPPGNEPVDVRYKTDDKDVVEYISQSRLKNKTAILYIVRMTLRLSAQYGTSLLRLTRLINDLGGAQEKPKKPRKEQPARPKEAPKAVEKDEDDEPAPMSMPRVRIRQAEQPVQPEVKQPEPAQDSAADEARNALSELQGLLGGNGEPVKKPVTEPEEEPDDDGDEGQGQAVVTNPFLSDFY